MFEYLQESHGDTAIFHLKGEMSLEETAIMRKVFWEALADSEVKKLICNLKDVVSVDASTISLFVATKSSMTKRKGCLILAAAAHDVYQNFEATNLNHYFDMRPSVESAMDDAYQPSC